MNGVVKVPTEDPDEKHNGFAMQHNADPDLEVSLNHGHFSTQGQRPEMEDKVSILPHPLFNEITNLRDGAVRSLFAVFDGHGGVVCAEYCRQHVHENFVAAKEFGTDPCAALRNALSNTDKAYLEGNLLVVANVGGWTWLLFHDFSDSRGVLCRAGKACAVSEDHKPSRKDERERIEALGGRVAATEEEAFSKKSPSFLASCCSCLGSCWAPQRPLRVFPGGLSVSRTIGDISMKSSALIISDPDMFATRLTDTDQFLILACDGVWDVLSNQQAVLALCFLDHQHMHQVDVVKKCVPDGEVASKAVVDEALRRGSTDNISVIVVFFQYRRTSVKDDLDHKDSDHAHSGSAVEEQALHPEAHRRTGSEPT